MKTLPSMRTDKNTETYKMAVGVVRSVSRFKLSLTILDGRIVGKLGLPMVPFVHVAPQPVVVMMTTEVTSVRCVYPQDNTVSLCTTSSVMECAVNVLAEEGTECGLEIPRDSQVRQIAMPTGRSVSTPSIFQGLPPPHPLHRITSNRLLSQDVVVVKLLGSNSRLTNSEGRPSYLSLAGVVLT